MRLSDLPNVKFVRTMENNTAPIVTTEWHPSKMQEGKYDFDYFAPVQTLKRLDLYTYDQVVDAIKTDLAEKKVAIWKIQKVADTSQHIVRYAEIEPQWWDKISGVQDTEPPIEEL